jgi:hypothetical protein
LCPMLTSPVSQCCSRGVFCLAALGLCGLVGERERERERLTEDEQRPD